MKRDNTSEPFFIIEEVAAEMIASGYEFERPPIPCTVRLRDVLESMSDAEPALQPGEIESFGDDRQLSKKCRNVFI